MNEVTISLLAGIIRNATPLVIAALGETITERAGVVNLSLDGSLVLSAMTGFVVAFVSGNVWLGVLAAALVGALVALIVAVADIGLRQDQVAVGFVLTLLCTDLARFLGQSYTRVPGPTIPFWPLPVLADVPVIGPIFFTHNALVYLSYALMLGLWLWLFFTRPGMAHRAVGERPQAAYARGTRVNAVRLAACAVGGGLVGVAGAAYALSLRPGWATPPSMAGDGWIALAIVIFGGWHPFRVVFGAYLFAGLRTLASFMQRSGVAFPVVLLNGLPWLLMILTLLLVSSGAIERLLRVLPRPAQARLRGLLRSDPPRALGTRFERGRSS